ncbi:substrate-binding domain-containing protein [Actinokineospora auranticolor]|uniref:ABC-type phosphate transport system substrate-binding protein n=1 Tax=Actinokineospora auranticolor TaxID=155976 RepID=A0A2S6GFS8_9PSEU|nr:substrate-binding domain-containing protein [Actinokineospora auranticolor]PPK64089.1 ABC-type phosphate transport system substrate-binding protein [Actinokineospora auranticolor]
MTEIRDALRAVLDFLGAGNLVLGIVLLIATPFVDRFLIRRKRVSYRVHYNSKIGLGPERLADEQGAQSGQPGQFGTLARLMDRLSIVVIRIRNTGGYDISADDFEKPLTFTFGKRVVWNARISEAGSDEVREQLREGLRFFRHDSGTAGAAREERDNNLGTVRDKMTQRMVRWIGGQAPAPREPEAEPRWHGVRLERLSLHRKQKFKLVVVLEEPEDNPTGDTSKEIAASGKLADNGIIKDEKSPRRITLARLTGIGALVLTVFLMASLLLASPPVGDDCVSGEVSVEGSSVFIPTMGLIAGDYTARCGDTKITTTSSGSIGGARDLAALEPDQARTHGALSDGRYSGTHPQLRSQQLAIVLYHVVVNKDVPVDNLPTSTLKQIFDGTITDWQQLDPDGPSRPIRIVGRGSDSGTRQLFEGSVLGRAEPALSSNDCQTKDRDPSAKVVRCELRSNKDIANTVMDTPGAIGYADAPTVAEVRKRGSLKALTLNGKVFDSVGVSDTGYPFWTVEYLYTKGEPAKDTALGAFAEYLHDNSTARLRLKDAGFIPCTTPEGAPVALCNTR